MVGLLIATVIYNELTKRYNALRLIGGHLMSLN